MCEYKNKSFELCVLLCFNYLLKKELLVELLLSVKCKHYLMGLCKKY